MRKAILISALALLSACSPREKPAEVASPAEASQMAEQAAAAISASSQSMASDSLSRPDTPREGTCLAAIGKAAADRLVKRCIQVSPATHPPCNVQNSCEMIQGEIDRSCAMYGADEKKPAECTA
ncbi:hypothetical protein AEAC466_08770 [Asticcacaulis sp. AC466]|uniref:hypothetical protein n=1 Tax=Asticcacaulis sp. AC466 TaxID=1282362 RepID=UPI0003C3F512|nr:hypothetical protein [Asticcacaulis sp. AC466]ESQ84436.1 hypothetical protein AEAC466_08770 [Asticcacaulis sp. AC466]